MEFKIMLNVPCKVYSNCSMINPSGKIIKETTCFIYLQEMMDTFETIDVFSVSVKTKRISKDKISTIVYK